MNFTGERVIPGAVNADLLNEHLARYVFAAAYVAGKRVLDVACGSGYGAAILGQTALRVVGADIAREAVDYARNHYAAPNTAFVQADCLSLPFRPAEFDVVVAFEIIEHIGDGVAFLQEMRLLLAAIQTGGVFAAVLLPERRRMFGQVPGLRGVRHQQAGHMVLQQHGAVRENHPQQLPEFGIGVFPFMERVHLAAVFRVVEAV
ncbi:MAG TPA: class I SAM-dependent methyltransferase, partial [Terriglobia bacterium]|nr:class I SAM-dependent methyltransferase [Terriglobia bacterium]